MALIIVMLNLNGADDRKRQMNFIEQRRECHMDGPKRPNLPLLVREVCDIERKALVA
jgi:hypothetical protein